MKTARTFNDRMNLVVKGSEKARLPRNVNLSAYVRMVIKIFIYSQDRLDKEFKENKEFRNCVVNIKEALDKFN